AVRFLRPRRAGLARALRARLAPLGRAAEGRPGGLKMRISKLIPPSAAFVAIALTAAVLLPAAKIRGFDLDRFSRLPVLEGGRVKPLDSVARNSLLLIRSQQAFTWQGRTVGADEWLLDVLFRPEIADVQPVFFINDPEVLGLIGLRQTSDRYFPFRDLGPSLDKIQQQATAAREIDSKQRTRFQGAIVNLFDRLYLYYRLQNTIEVKDGPRLSEEIAQAADPGSAERQADVAQLAAFRPLPPAANERPEGWRSVGEALRGAREGGVDRGLEQLARIGDAYASQDPALFNVGVATFE